MRTPMLWIVLACCGDAKRDDAVTAQAVPPVRSVDASVPAPPAPEDAASAAPAPPADAGAPRAEIAPDTRAAFAELLDPRKRFVYEIVEGRTFATLRRVRGTPRIIGTLDAPKPVEGVFRAMLWMRPEEGVARDHASTAFSNYAIVFDADGIRQLAAPGGTVRSKSNIRGFTFPHTLDAPVTIEERPDFGSITIRIKRAPVVVGNARRDDVTVAEAKLVEERYGNATSYETFAYAPGVGPVLLCGGRTGDLGCLRYLATEDRLCAKLAAKLCEGKVATCEDESFAKLQLDRDGKPDFSYRAEKQCRAALADPAELERVRQQVGG